MISLIDAVGLIEKILSENEERDMTFEISKIESFRYGWIFYYTLSNYDPNDHTTWLAGNAPFIVDKTDGSVHATGTARKSAYYVEEYIREREKSADT